MRKKRKMTLRQFRQWCNERACDGRWAENDVKFCIELLDAFDRMPWWKRRMVWNKVAFKIMVEVVYPINRKIEETDNLMKTEDLYDGL